MKLTQIRIRKAGAVVLFCTVLLWAQPARQKIAILGIKAKTSASKQAALTEKVLDEIFKMDLFIVIEQERVNKVMTEQGMGLYSCSKTDCAVKVGKGLGVEKVIFGEVKMGENKNQITLKMADVLTQKMIKRSSINIEGTLKNVLASGILKATRGLVGSFIGKQGLSTQSKKYTKKRNVRLVSAILCAATGTGFGGACGYYWSEKKKYIDLIAKSTYPLKDKYKQEEDDATKTAAIFTGTSVAFFTSSIILFLIMPEDKQNKSVSINPSISPDNCGVTVSFSF